ncbi:MAG: hypothetical protein FWF28_07470 [Micrococcales bacterium]|nr:hypothetical protein [Micrococcales bacterium]
MTAPLDDTTLDLAAEQRINAAPLPTPATLRNRKNLFYQLTRFAAINIRMLRVIRSSS